MRLRKKHQKPQPNLRLNPRKSNRLPKKQVIKPKHQLKLPVKKSRSLPRLPPRKLIKSPKTLKPSRKELIRKLTVKKHQKLKPKPHQPKQKPLQLLQFPNQLPKHKQKKKMKNKTRELLQSKVRNQTKINFLNLTLKLTQSEITNFNIYFVFKEKLINIKN